MLTHGIRTLFLAQSAITSLAPAQTVGRVSLPCVFCDNAKQGVVPPYVVIKEMDVDPLMTLDAVYHAAGQIDTIDVVSYAYNMPAARLLNKTVREYFQDYSGNATAGGITDVIKAVTWIDESYDYFYPGDGVDTKWHTITTTYSVHYVQGS